VCVTACSSAWLVEQVRGRKRGSLGGQGGECDVLELGGVVGACWACLGEDTRERWDHAELV